MIFLLLLLFFFFFLLKILRIPSCQYDLLLYYPPFISTL